MAACKGLYDELHSHGAPQVSYLTTPNAYLSTLTIYTTKNKTHKNKTNNLYANNLLRILPLPLIVSVLKNFMYFSMEKHCACMPSPLERELMQVIGLEVPAQFSST